MTIAPHDLAAIAQRVATQVRKKVPRSSNRMKDVGSPKSVWIKNQSDIGYTDFILTISRIRTHNSTQTDIREVTVEGLLNPSVNKLKRMVLDFVQNGYVDGNRINLNYIPGLAAEKEYSQKFGAALAEYLNTRVVRDGLVPFKADTVMMRVKLAMLVDERSIRHTKELGSAAPLPMKYVESSAKNAFRFQLGNCEECACAAFAMLTTFTTSDGKALSVDRHADRVRLELVKGWSSDEAHYFVLLNRSGARDIFEDFARWFNDPTVVVCDPWMTDEGVGDIITSNNRDMFEVKKFLNRRVDHLTSMASLEDLPSPLPVGLQSLVVRATGHLGMNRGLMNRLEFYLENT